MKAAPATEAFRLLGVPPFLFADGEAFEHLKKSFSQKARTAHPDLVPEGDDKAREQAEALSAALNSAWRQVKDFEGRLELALTAYPETEKPSKVAPDIALRYFELQEMLLEGAAGAQKELDALQAEVSSRLAVEKSKLYEISRRYPLKPAAPGSLPADSWEISDEDLTSLRAGRNTVRYLERLGDDLEKNS